jgi:hypothetical protein
MSDLTNIEKRKFEQLLAMGDGYVLNFSNRTFSEFVIDSTGRNPYDAHYDHGSSKANPLRGFSDSVLLPQSVIATFSADEQRSGNRHGSSKCLPAPDDALPGDSAGSNLAHTDVSRP